MEYGELVWNWSRDLWILDVRLIKSDYFLMDDAELKFNVFVLKKDMQRRSG